jgi:hypothetical protein
MYAFVKEDGLKQRDIMRKHCVGRNKYKDGKTQQRKESTGQQAKKENIKL